MLQKQVDTYKVGQNKSQVTSRVRNTSTKNFGVKFHPSKQGSLNFPFWEDQTMQMYGNFEGFPLIGHCLGW